MTKQVDKDQNFMRNQWGTEFLSSEYGWETKIEKQKMLREIANDELTPKSMTFFIRAKFTHKFVMMKTMMIGNMAQNQSMNPKILNK